MQYGKGDGRGSRRAAVECALAMSAPLAVGVPALASGGGNGPEAAPGQLKKEQTAAVVPAPPPQAQATGHRQSRSAKGHSGKAPAPRAAPATTLKSAPKAAKPTQKKEKAKPPAGSHGPAGKTTLCHATGSATNPYVTITVSNNAVPAHDRHQNDEDIIPAPAGGCPGAAQSLAPGTPGTTPRGTTPGGTVPPGHAAAGAFAAPAAPPATAETVLAPESAVLGETETGEAPGAVAKEAENRVAGAAQSSGGGLPFTGLDLGLVALAGLALLLAGVAGRRGLTQ
jgi:hypothetical protein